MDATILENSRKLNDARFVNKIPSELLGRIFILGTEEHRSFRKPFSRDVRFQDTVVQVCYRWREVGLCTPELWTSIFVSETPSYERILLYLVRAGPTRPLDIEWDIPRSRSEDAIPYVHQVSECIISHGGTTDRWRSLVVRAKNLEALFVVVSLVDTSPTPALRFLSLKWRFHNQDPVHMADIDKLIPPLDDSHLLSSGSQRPQLSHVELIGLPVVYILRRNPPMLSNLRHLKLSRSGYIYLANRIGELLSASPQLTYLSIDVGTVHGPYFPRSYTAPPISILPSLRSFSLRILDHSRWGLRLLKSIDAPAVESFRLSCKGGNTSELVNFLCTGRLNGVLHPESSPSDAQSGPIFPSLRSLHLNHLEMPKDWARLMAAYPMVTELTLDFTGLLAFVNLEAFPPNQLHIRFSHATLALSSIYDCIQKVARHSPTRFSIIRQGTQAGMNKKCEELGNVLRGVVDRVEIYDEEEDFTPEFD